MAATDIFRSMIAYWKSFDLRQLQEELDQTASIIAVQCEETDISRQLLLQKSRDFNRNCPEDVQKGIAPLLKSFQLEIDGLLRRSKLAESAFLSVYRKVIHMPDMLPIFEQLQSEVERLSGYSVGFCSEEVKEVDNSSKNKCSKEDDVCMNSNISLNSESNENHQNDKRDAAECIHSSCENSHLSGDAIVPPHSFTANGIPLVAERPNEDKKDLFIEQNLSAHNHNADVANSDGVVSYDDRRAESSARIQEQESAGLGSSDRQVFIKPDQNDTSQSKGAMDDVIVEEVDETRAISEDCKTQKMQMDLRIDNGSAQVFLEDQMEQDADLKVKGVYKSSVESLASLSVRSDDDRDVKLNSVEVKNEHDCKKDQTLDLVRDHAWNDFSQSGDEKEVHNLGQCKQKFTRQFGADKGMSDISLSNLESLASEIGQEVVSSFQNSQHRTPNLWPPNAENGKAESSAFYDSDVLMMSSDIISENLKSEPIDDLASLDTTDVSCRIREILSFHNLGQRLFARYVLGLSQGTVSELLSKPKPWEKLTEKGRESYRKMHEWASDKRNIQVLKSLSSPKCGVSSSSSSNDQTDPGAAERIAQILSEAQAAMQCKQEALDELQFQSNAMLAPKVSELQVETVEAISETNKGSRKSKTSRKGNGHALGSHASKNRKARVDSENLTRDIVTRIYQEELEKLAQVAEANGNMVELLGYRQELAKLGQGLTKRPCKPDGHKSESEDKENHKETVAEITMIPKRHLTDSVDGLLESSGETSDEPQDLSVSISAEAHRLSLEGIDLSVLRSNDSPSPLPSVLPVSLPSCASNNGLLSPLQRMQSIANSLTLQSSSSSSTALQPTRAVLPPISQEQFDMYANINTDDLVKRVKDMLSQYSISQRLFGEYVLGLSQGSVSDLLARPKPWHLLTHKGREPFIRMQMFADDPDAIQKQVASQYRVSAEKLLHSNSSSHSDVASHEMVNDSVEEVAESCNIPSTAFPSSKPFQAIVTGHSDTTPPPCASVSSAPVFSSVSSSQSASGSLPAAFDDKSLANGVGLSSMGIAMVPSVLSLFGATFLPSAQFGPLVNVDVHRLYGNAAGASSEVGTGTASHELDTQAITARVKEVLQLNSLGQKLFGEAVLELSQGSVSELLSKPKPWHMLSLKGREPFVKMQIWLNDPLGVQKLHTYQTHMTGRRRKSGCDGSSSDRPGNQKKPRLFFSEEQKVALKAAYIRDPYPNQLAIEQLASELDIGVKTVINWFHNHRMRAKQHHSCNSPTSTTAGSPSSSVLARIKSEAPDDLTDQSVMRSTIMFPQEDNSASSNSSRSRCDSGTSSGFEGRANKLTSGVGNPKCGSSFSSSGVFSCSKNNNLENKRRELNKRKRARPHRLYNGAGDAGGLQVAEEYQTTLDMAIDLSVNRSGGDVKNDHLLVSKPGMISQVPVIQGKIFKNQSDDSSLQVSDAADVKIELSDNWNNSRVRNIEKLQQNLLLAPSDDWEF